MVRPRGIPDELDAAMTQRMARSLLAVRIVRGSLLLLFLAIAFVATEVKGWPPGVAVAIALTALIQTGALAASCRRYAWIASHSPRGESR
jgi:hypothetical protein